MAEKEASRRGNAIVPYWRAPASFKRMLGSTFGHSSSPYTSVWFGVTLIAA